MKDGAKLAQEHVDWLLNTFVELVRPLMLAEFEHGYKHGVEDREEEGRCQEASHQ